MSEYDAILRDWAEVNWGDSKVLIGKIFEDSKGRFLDGMEVRTSSLKSIVDNIATTKNTRYLLENPR
ncbi:hypothetical protein [Caulobacter phage Cr30]|uniref:hypothetical protein n=1 Tax=Caulobacter phage Cr30 TaxID=1357714 RepID=UPI0004A9B666|nr:hypothetical protein OZ74_gp212 [Caulobacter phage Cr30]AGS81131.1 hypothetical protein [Caulobacter phage Cr30]